MDVIEIEIKMFDLCLVMYVFVRTPFRQNGEDSYKVLVVCVMVTSDNKTNGNSDDFEKLIFGETK